MEKSRSLLMKRDMSTWVEDKNLINMIIFSKFAVLEVDPWFATHRQRPCHSATWPASHRPLLTNSCYESRLRKLLDEYFAAWLGCASVSRSHNAQARFSHVRCTPAPCLECIPLSGSESNLLICRPCVMEQTFFNTCCPVRQAFIICC